MDINPIDIKIREFALYLKDFGLLNETNINDFLKKFKSISENSIMSSGIFETDVNVGLIYLKENLSNTMFEFYNLMTEERKKIIYLNIYSKFLKKRDEELNTKGKALYSKYVSLIIKKYFSYWKEGNSKNNNENTNKNRINKNKDILKISNINQEYKKDNFCFGIISDNELLNNNLVINSNNNKIVINTNNSYKFNKNATINSINTNMNNIRNNNINTFLMTSKNRYSEKKLREKNNIKNIQTPTYSPKKTILSYKKGIYNEEVVSYNNYKNNHENMLDQLIFPQYPQNNNIMIKNDIIEENIYNNLNTTSARYTLDPNKRINNIKKNNNINNNKSKKKVNANFQKEKSEIYRNQNILKQRNTYNYSRPNSSLHYNENNENSRISVYQRLYDQNKEKMKRQEDRIKENIKEIKERANHPIMQKKNSNDNFKNTKKSNISKQKTRSSNNNTIYTNKYRITYDGENPNFFDKQYVSDKIDEALFNKNLNRKKSRYTNDNDSNFNSNIISNANSNFNSNFNSNADININNDINDINNDDEKKNDGMNFMENQRKCIQLFNDMIGKEEKTSGIIFDEKEKENMFKDLLNKLYKENKTQNYQIKNNNINSNEYEKFNEGNSNYNNICDSVEINLK